MITKVTSRQKLKDMFLELLLANTNQVTKVTPGSILNATGHGIAALSQRILKDISVLESNIFPESAFGSLLDALAERNGIPARFTLSESTTFLRLEADSGTTYIAGVNNFTGRDGIIFELDADVTIGAIGFDYAKVRSTSTGAITNVDPFTLTTVTPTPPAGHSQVFNEFRAEGGRDNESDDTFRQRITEGVNILATGTLASYEQAFMKINSNVLRLFKGGINASGQIKIFVLAVNGVDFTVLEFQDIIDKGNDFLSLTEQAAGLELVTIPFFATDVSLRVELEPSADPDETRIDMQIKMQKHLDFRFWEFGDIIERDDLLFIARQTPGVKRILDNFFFVNGGIVDITPPNFVIPRLRSFTMFDENGIIISDTTGVLNPAFFPNQIDFLLQQTLLPTI